MSNQRTKKIIKKKRAKDKRKCKEYFPYGDKANWGKKCKQRKRL